MNRTIQKRAHKNFIIWLAHIKLDEYLSHWFPPVSHTQPQGQGYQLICDDGDTLHTDEKHLQLVKWT